MTFCIQTSLESRLSDRKKPLRLGEIGTQLPEFLIAELCGERIRRDTKARKQRDASAQHPRDGEPHEAASHHDRIVGDRLARRKSD